MELKNTVRNGIIIINDIPKKKKKIKFSWRDCDIGEVNICIVIGELIITVALTEMMPDSESP